MRTRWRKLFFELGVFLMAIVGFEMVLAQKVFAVDDSMWSRYAQNSIFFYDPDDCHYGKSGGSGSGFGSGGGGGGSWDGTCTSVSSYYSKMSKYYDAVHDVAERNGLPWEGIMAQLIGESSLGAHEVCAYNPLGLKPGKSGLPTCDGKHAIFDSYDAAFNHYVHGIRPVREAMGKFKNDPYGYVDFLINGIPGYKYATDPDYVQKISGYVCGVQKWAKDNGKPISGSGPPEGTKESDGDGGEDDKKGDGGDDDGDDDSDDDHTCKDGGGGGDDDEDGDPIMDPSSMIFYSQCDSRWKNYMYGSGGISGSSGKTICKAGCGPTSFAVIAANLKGNKSITPAETADLAGKAGMYVPGSGSSHGITSYLAGEYGLSAVKIPGTISAINEYLDKGYMIHTSGKGGRPFSAGGHYIAIVKRLDNGNWLVGDSSKHGPSGEYSPDTVIKGMTKDNVWAVK